MVLEPYREREAEDQREVMTWQSESEHWSWGPIERERLRTRER